MAEPVRGGGGAAPRRTGREQTGQLAGRRVRHLSPDLTRTIHALGLRQIPVEGLEPLNDEQLALAKQMRPHFTADMSPVKRMIALELALYFPASKQRLEEFVETINNCPLDRLKLINDFIHKDDTLEDALRLISWVSTAEEAEPANLKVCSKLFKQDYTIADRKATLGYLNKTPATDRQALVVFLEETGNLDHLSTFCSAPKERWSPAYWTAKAIADETAYGALRDKIAELLQIDNIATIHKTLNYLANNTLEVDHPSLFVTVSKFTKEEHAVAFYAQGPGNLDQKLKLVKQLSSLPKNHKELICELLYTRVYGHTNIKHIEDFANQVLEASRDCPPDRLKLLINLINIEDPFPKVLELISWASRAAEAEPESLAACAHFFKVEAPVAYRKSFLKFLKRVPAEDRKALVDFLKETDPNLLPIFSRAPKERWRPAYKIAQITAHGEPYEAFKQAVTRHLKAENIQDVYHSLKYLGKDLTYPELTQLFYAIKDFSAEAHEFTYYARGPGAGAERLQLVNQLTSLPAERKKRIIPLIDALVSKNTPIHTVRQFAAKLADTKYLEANAIEEFIEDAFLLNRPLLTISIDSNSPALNQIVEALKVNIRPTLLDSKKDLKDDLLLKRAGDEMDYTKAFLIETRDGMRELFSSILETDAKGDLLLKRLEEPSNEQIEEAAALGSLLSLFIRDHVFLPENFRLSKGLFRAMNDSQRLQPHLKAFQIGFTGNYRIRSGTALLQFLCKPPLPLPPVARRYSKPLTSPAGQARVEEMAKKHSLSAPIALQLFKDDADISAPFLQQFAQLENCESLFEKSIPLFFPSDSSEMRLQMMERVTQYEPKQIEHASRLIFEDDPIDTRIEMVEKVGTLPVPETALPILPSDTVNNRLKLVERIVNDQTAATAAQIPLFKSPIIWRADFIKALSLIQSDLNPAERDTLIRVLRELGSRRWSRATSFIASLPLEQAHLYLSLEPINLRLICHFASTLSSLSTKTAETIHQCAASSDYGPFYLFNRVIHNEDADTVKEQIFQLLCDTNQNEQLAQQIYMLRDNRAETITAFHAMSREDREQILTQLQALPPLTGHVFSMLVQIPRAEQAGAARSFVRLITNQTKQIQGQLAFAVRQAQSAEEVELRGTAALREIMAGNYTELERVVVRIQEGSLFPQLFPYLSRQQDQRLYIERPGSPAIDEGGPSREVLSKLAQEEMENYEPDVYTRDQDHIYHFQIDQGSPQLARAFGQQLYLMICLGVPLPDNMIFAEEEFEKMASIFYGLLDHNFDELLANSSQSLETLQQLYRYLYTYDLQIHPEYVPDQLLTLAQIEEEIKSDEPGLSPEEIQSRIKKQVAENIEILKIDILQRKQLFLVAQALSQDGHVGLSPLFRRMLTPPPKLRPRLKQASSWNFSQLQGNTELQKDYLLRWVDEATDEQLQLFVKSMTGLENLPEGQSLQIRNAQFEGVYVHYCFNLMDIPLIPRDDEVIHVETAYAEERARLTAIVTTAEANLNALFPNETPQKLQQLGETLRKAKNAVARAKAAYDQKIAVITADIARCEAALSGQTREEKIEQLKATLKSAQDALARIETTYTQENAFLTDEVAKCEAALIALAPEASAQQVKQLGDDFTEAKNAIERADTRFEEKKAFIERCIKFRDYEQWKRLLEKMPLGDTTI